MEYRFGRGANADVRAALRYYELHSDEVPGRFLRAVMKAAKDVSLHPGRYPREEVSGSLREFRRFVLDDFPFSLIYEVKPDELIILAVAHHRRRSGYWRRRTG
jgi:plasmid stabilization system protein ParE